MTQQKQQKQSKTFELLPYQSRQSLSNLIAVAQGLDPRLN